MQGETPTSAVLPGESKAGARTTVPDAIRTRRQVPRLIAALLVGIGVCSYTFGVQAYSHLQHDPALLAQGIPIGATAWIISVDNTPHTCTGYLRIELTAGKEGSTLDANGAFELNAFGMKTLAQLQAVSTFDSFHELISFTSDIHLGAGEVRSSFGERDIPMDVSITSGAQVRKLQLPYPGRIYLVPFGKENYRLRLPNALEAQLNQLPGQFQLPNIKGRPATEEEISICSNQLLPTNNSDPNSVQPII